MTLRSEPPVNLEYQDCYDINKVDKVRLGLLGRLMHRVKGSRYYKKKLSCDIQDSTFCTLDLSRPSM